MSAQDKKLDLTPDAVAQCIAPKNGEYPGAVMFRGWFGTNDSDAPAPGVEKVYLLWITGDEYFEFREADILHRQRNVKPGPDDSTVWVRGDCRIRKVHVGTARELAVDLVGDNPYGGYPKYK